MESVLNEYGVLGSLLIDPSLFPEAAELSDKVFSSLPLQEIFRAMCRQYEESGGFDALTVRAEAGRNCTDVTDKLLVGMMDTTPTTANLDAYIAAVKEAALARSLREIGEELLNAERTPSETLGYAQDALQRLADGNTQSDSQTLTEALTQLGHRVSEQVNGKAHVSHQDYAHLTKSSAAVSSMVVCTSSVQDRRSANQRWLCRSRSTRREMV